jgi:hypothetical protein
LNKNIQQKCFFCLIVISPSQSDQMIRKKIAKFLKE